MDDVSLSSSRNNVNGNNHNPLSSAASVGGASVSSKFSRRGKSLKNGDLGVPLTSTSLEERDEQDGNYNAAAVPSAAASAPPPLPTATATATKRGSYISEDDPFHIFRTDLVQKLGLVEEELDRYLSVVRTTDTAANAHAVKETKKQLKRHIKHAESTLNDLETTVRVVERQREKFPHIHDGELRERRQFVHDSKSRISTARSTMHGDDVKSKLSRDERALTERRRADKKAANNTANGDTKYNKIQSTDDDDDDAFDLENGGGNAARNSASSSSSTSHNDPARAETLAMMQQQDETLEDLDLAVTRVGYMAETIHEEIDTQNIMLKSLEEDLADAEEQLGVVMGKLAKLLKTKSKCQLGLIVVLSLIVLVLFFLVIYT
eukprot:CAMPEP_0183722986 /NCGR_PEP_ID=MMETSP0737-20130205/14757_1 /TAXON_ID=385413 /ORGANISM="Thalassiosira miniscula, Strain CCMP1093" /LENGTH=377 /DNA_ID=CAMNT_0025953235 /DNA_START=107 /DNA_END=1240 /DNA_ORIENTATION=+